MSGVSLVEMYFYNEPGQPEVVLGSSAPSTSWIIKLVTAVSSLSLLPTMLSLHSYWSG